MEKLASELKKFGGDKFVKKLSSLDAETVTELRMYLDDMYYNTGVSDFPDEKYDKLIDYMKEENIFSYKIGSKLRENENRVDLPFWMGSADKITPKDEDVLNRWVSKNRCLSKDISDTYVVTEKLDGVSCLAFYDDGKIKLYTRGDGTVGADISYLASIFNLPRISEGKLYIRGELIIPKKVFEEKYKNKVVNDREYKNPRNMVSGLIGSKTARIGLSDINFVPYEIVEDSAKSPENQLSTLDDLGFRPIKKKIIKTISVKKLMDEFYEFKGSSIYELDGIIVQSNVPYDRNISGNPDYMFAFKVSSDEDAKETKVISVEWNVSKWGQLKPVVIVEPVVLNDITINRATAHNASYILENNLGKGSIIKIIRSKEVIPYIVEVVKGTKAEFPKEGTWNWDKNRVNIFTTQESDEICIKLIANFFSQLGIKFVSQATVGKMIKGGLDSIIKIISADKKRLLEIPEFQEKSADRIYKNIRKGLEDVKMSHVLGASSVLGFGIGIKRIEALLLDIPNLFSLYKDLTKKELLVLILNVEGFSDIMATQVVKNIKYGVLFLEKISPYVKFKKETRTSEDMKGHKYVFSGFRDKTMEQLIAERGGKTTSSVSKNTTGIVVINKKENSTKIEKARKLGITIYSKEEFSEFLKG